MQCRDHDANHLTTLALRYATFSIGSMRSELNSPRSPPKGAGSPRTRNPYDANNARGSRLLQVRDPSLETDPHTFSPIAPGVTTP